MLLSVKEENFEHKNSLLVAELTEVYGAREHFALLQGAWPEYFGLSAGTFIFLEPVWRSCGDLEYDLELLGSTKSCDFPFACGYFAYELLHQFENVPSAKLDLLQLPKYFLCRYAKLVYVPDRPNQAVKLFQFEFEDCSRAFWQAEGLSAMLNTAAFPERLQENNNAHASTLSPQTLQRHLAPYSNFTPQAYQEAVSDIRELIAAGKVYQINLSQQFSLPFRGDPRAYYNELQRISPARFAAYLNSPAGQIASSSPELFVASQEGKLISSPIKGTRARFADPELDLQAELELKSSEKDRAELAMIVDLVRNDLGRIAEIGSVRVQQHARLEKLAQVQHLVSDVCAELAPGRTLKDVLTALFPCGSITGCPKIAAMKYIAELEGRTRGVYTGAIACFASARDFALNVAIRTALIRDSKLIFQTGGGVVYDSEPAKEYEESLIKAAGLYRAYAALEIAQQI